MIVVFGHVKGGVGKTTLAMNFAIEQQRRGASVVVVDCDRSAGTSRIWADDRAKEGLPVIPVLTLDGNLIEPLQSLEDQYDVVVVDVKGGDTTEMRTALLVAEALVIPTSGQQNDLDSLDPMSRAITPARDLNPELRTLVALTRVSPQGKAGEVAAAKDYLQDYPELTLAQTVITTTTGWSRARTEGRGVVEVTGPQKALMQILTDEITGGN